MITEKEKELLDELDILLNLVSKCHIDIGEGESQSALCRKIEMKELEELMQY